jgi:hypothetical protein
MDRSSVGDEVSGGGSFEPQLLDDFLASRLAHFFAAVVRKDRSVAVRGGDFEVATFGRFEGHPLGFQPSSELAVFHHLVSSFGETIIQRKRCEYNENVLFSAKKEAAPQWLTGIAD